MDYGLHTEFSDKARTYKRSVNSHFVWLIQQHLGMSDTNPDAESDDEQVEKVNKPVKIKLPKAQQEDVLFNQLMESLTDEQKQALMDLLEEETPVIENDKA
jgi:hypothetical protein